MKTAELEAELKRRKTKHNIRIGDTVFALDLDQMEEINKLMETFQLPPPLKTNL